MGRNLPLAVLACLLSACGQTPSPASPTASRVAVAPPPTTVNAAATHVAMADADPVPPCNPDDDRTEVPLWAPTLDGKGNLADFPPTREGLIVHVDLLAPADAAGCAADTVRAFPVPDTSPGTVGGGLSVRLRGNAETVDGRCRFRGYYESRPMTELGDYWSQVEFAAVDMRDGAHAGKYCLSPRSYPPGLLAGETPDAFARRFFKRYLSTMEDVDWFADRALLAMYFDPAMVELFQRENSCRRQHGMCNLDFDPFIDAQDYDENIFPSLQATALGSATPARVKVSFRNLGQTTTLTLTLSKVDGQWRIRDLQSPNYGSLKAILEAPAAPQDEAP